MGTRKPPFPYQGAQLDVDDRALLAIARLKWAALSKHMRDQLVACWPKGQRDPSTHLDAQTLRALHRRGLCDTIGWALTGIGHLVREVGIGPVSDRRGGRQ